MNRLIVITGATGTGKTDLAVQLAQRLGCDVISADSRQLYRGIPIGTAQPTPEQMAGVRHHFIATLPLDRQYSAAQYEADVMALLPQLWRDNDTQVLCGGSMMYIDAVMGGIDELPTITPQVRRHVMQMYADGGLQQVRERLLLLDPVSHHRVDPLNPRRNIHALEICLQAGVPASSLLTGSTKQRPFQVVKFSIDMPREQMFDRINRRVDAMIEAGLVDEARSVLHLRHLNALNTVGYKEMFAYFDGLMDYDTTVARIAKNTRVYAKKQLTWLHRQDGTPAAAIPVKTIDDILLHI